MATEILHSKIHLNISYIAGAKKGLAVSERLIEAHIWLIVNLISTSWNNSLV